MVLIFCAPAFGQQPVYLDSTAAIENRVDDLMARMSLDEKIGQMTQAERGALENIGEISQYYLGSLLSGGGSAPQNPRAAGWADMYDAFQDEALAAPLRIPLIYGVDAVHGHNNVLDAVIFPHNIGLGCTRNPELVREAAVVTATEVAATGIDWTFAPCIAVPRDERWGRTYEGFGETPELAEMFAPAAVGGLQGDTLSGPVSVLACAKHFIGDGGTTLGDDQGNAQISEATLRAIHLPGYIRAIESGVGSIMATYNSWNGNKVHGSHYLLTTLLKEELGFEGFVVSDWAAIDQLPGDYTSDVETSINAGIDMVMVPTQFKNFISILKNLVMQGKVSQARIDDAVRRILTIKFKMGLFERPYTNRNLLSTVGSAEHRQVARQAVRESLVLLKKKDNILPLPKNDANILVMGSHADNLGYQCGGWTISWQGGSGNITEGTTVLDGLMQSTGSSQIRFSESEIPSDFNADYAVVVIGETPYAEGNGDREDLSLSPNDIHLVQNLKASGLPVILVLISGRPMILEPFLHYSDAIIAAWLPGTEGRGIADILFGDYPPTGLLGHSWPRNMQQIPINEGDEEYDPLYAYGFGISSLQNSPAGSAPQLQSAAAGPNGQTLEITFNKAMQDPASSTVDFKVRLNNAPQQQYSTVQRKAGDPTTLVITLNQPVQRGDELTVAYVSGTLKSADGGVLNPFGEQPVYNALDDQAQAMSIPGRIEAEDYMMMSGVQTETCYDEGGGLNVGYIDAGDWMDFPVTVSGSGIYRIHFRLAGQSAEGQFQLLYNDSLRVTVNTPVTGGWQDWTTVTSGIQLKAGSGIMRIRATKPGFNINWFSFEQLTDVREPATAEPADFALYANYPNPFNPATTIAYFLPQAGKVTLEICDVNGQVLQTLVNGQRRQGRHSVQWNAADAASGMYFYRLQSGAFKQTRKMLLVR